MTRYIRVRARYNVVQLQHKLTPHPSWDSEASRMHETFCCILWERQNKSAHSHGPWLQEQQNTFQTCKQKPVNERKKRKRKAIQMGFSKQSARGSWEKKRSCLCNDWCWNTWKWIVVVQDSEEKHKTKALSTQTHPTKPSTEPRAKCWRYASKEAC